MSMIRFANKNDPGYVKICDVLWLWIRDIEKKSDEHVQNDSPSNAHAGDGSVYSGGGPVFVGSNNAGRDVTNIRFVN